MRIKNIDIARALGISTTAVSLAINNRPGVSEETRFRVMQLIRDYAKRSAEESSLSADSENGAVLLSVHKKHGEIINDKPFYQDLIETIQLEAMRESYTLIVSHFIPGQNISEYMEHLRNSPATGIIILGTEMTPVDYAAYKALTIPVVLLDASFPLIDTDAVVIDNQASIIREIGYAVKKGLRNIGYLRSSLWTSNFQQRYDGFLNGLDLFGLAGENHPVIDLPCSIEGSYLKMKAILENKPKGFALPEVFLSDLDHIALGAMKALKEKGYRIPEDISMIGYDDMKICMISDPKLTSTRANQFALGQTAVVKLMELIERKPGFYTVTEVASELMVRESVRDVI